MAEVVEREITVPVEPDEAWRLVTESDQLERWFAPQVELDPRPGGPVRAVEVDGGERHGVVEQVDAPHRLRFVWYAPPDGAFFAVAGPREMGDTSRTIGFLVADLAAAVDELRAAGVEVDEPAANDRHRYVHFRAPDGKLYELVE